MSFSTAFVIHSPAPATATALFGIKAGWLYLNCICNSNCMSVVVVVAVAVVDVVNYEAVTVAESDTAQLEPAF